jgi:uncharacterized protein YciI
MRARAAFALTICLAFGAAISPAQQRTQENTGTASQQPVARSYFIRLIPPRPTFAQDITPEETTLMKAHYAYWSDEFVKGVCLFGGPVLDPKGVYGVLVVKAASQDEATAIAAADTSVKGGLNRIEVAEIRVAFFAKHD